MKEKVATAEASAGATMCAPLKRPCGTPTKGGDWVCKGMYPFAEDFKGEQPLKSWQAYTILLRKQPLLEG